MGSNQSKLCAGDPEREYRRAEQDRIQWVYRKQQQTPSDTAHATVHIHCSEEDVDYFMEGTNAAAIMFHFKVIKSPVIQPENCLEDGEPQSLAKTSGAEEITSAVLVEAKITEPGDVVVRPETSGDVVVRSEPSGDILVGTDARPTELDWPLARVCNNVIRALHVVEKSFRDSSGRTKAHSTVEDLSPSSTEPQLPTVGSDYQTMSPPIAAAESWRAGDVHCPNEEAFLVNDRNAPCETALELATKDALGAAEEPMPGPTQLDEASSEEALEVAEAPPHLVSAETSDEHSDVKTHLGTKELAELLLSLGKDLPPAVGKPQVLKEMEEKVPEGYCGVETQLEELRMRDQHEMTAVVTSDHETEWPTASIIFHNSGLQLLQAPEAVCDSCKKINVADLHLAGDATNCDALQKYGAIRASESMDEHQTSVVQNKESQPPTDVAEMTMALLSLKALLEKETCPIEAIDQVSKTQANNLSAQLPLEATPILGAALEQGASGQRR